MNEHKKFRGNRLKNQSLGLIVGSIGGFAACLLVVGVSGCKRGGGEVIATVNGEAITAEDFNKYLEHKTTVQVVLSDNSVTSLPVAGSLGFQAMQDMIGQTVTLQLAKDKGIYPTEDEINKELEFQKKLKPTFLTEANASGLTLDMIRRDLVLEMIQDRLISKDAKVTTEDAKKYYAQNKDKFKDPKSVDVSIVLVRDARTQKAVDQALDGGQSFSTVALKYSEDDNAKKYSGHMAPGPIPFKLLKDKMPSVYEKVKNMSAGQRTDWISTSGGSAKFLVNKVVEETPIVMDDTKTEQLRRMMAKEKGGQSRDANLIVLRKLKDSKVDVQRQAYQSRWKEAYTKFMQDSKMGDLTGANGN